MSYYFSEETTQNFYRFKVDVLVLETLQRRSILMLSKAFSFPSMLIWMSFSYHVLTALFNLSAVCTLNLLLFLCWFTQVHFGQNSIYNIHISFYGSINSYSPSVENHYLTSFFENWERN